MTRWVGALVGFVVVSSCWAAENGSTCTKRADSPIVQAFPGVKSEKLTQAQFLYALGFHDGFPPPGHLPDKVDGGELLTSPDGNHFAILFTLGPLACGGLGEISKELVDYVKSIGGDEL